MRSIFAVAAVAGALTLIAGPVAAQAAAADSTADSTATRLAAAPPPAPVNNLRAAWLSDRRPLRVGDVLTIVIDEQATANERVSTTATADRSQRAGLGLNVDSAVRLGPAKEFSTGLGSSSRDVGEAGRAGNLTAVLTVRVMSVEPNGTATIEGTKSVTVDGRSQEVQLRGVVRAEDVSARNLVSSSRVADAVITYKGKKIGPRTGIIGKLLSIFWP